MNQTCDNCRYTLDPEAPCPWVGDGGEGMCGNWKAEPKEPIEPDRHEVAALKAELAKVTEERDEEKETMFKALARAGQAEADLAAARGANLVLDERAGKLEDALARIKKEGPMRRYGSNVPHRLYQWVLAVREEAGDAIAEHRKGME